MQCIARAILVPGFVFLGGTLLRKKLNFPRPYEQPGFTPLVEKETHGQSFPSRHALSAAVLAAVWLSFYPAVGGVMVAVTVAICVLRVLAGVHFPRDVIAVPARFFAWHRRNAAALRAARPARPKNFKKIHFFA